MQFLVLYGTTEGQTRKIAEFVSDRIQVRGHQATLADAMDRATLDISPRDFDTMIIAASVHVGRYQSGVEAFVRRHQQILNQMPTAFFSVSLAAASSDPDDIKDIEACVARFSADTRWTPDQVHHVNGAFRSTQVDFFKRWGMKVLAHQRGVATDTARDLELTDWISLASVTDAFVSAAARQTTLIATNVPLRGAQQF